MREKQKKKRVVVYMYIHKKKHKIIAQKEKVWTKYINKERRDVTSRRLDAKKKNKITMGLLLMIHQNKNISKDNTLERSCIYAIIPAINAIMTINVADSIAM